MPTITVIASYATELIFRVPRLMRLGETLPATFELGYGGKGFNMTAAAHKAGANVHMIAKLGKDPFGARARQHMQELGIPTEFVFDDPKAPSGAGTVLVTPDGNNAIAVDMGANLNLTAAEVQRASKVIAASRVVLASLETPTEAIAEGFRIAKIYGVTTILNPAPAPFKPLSSELRSLTDIITPNESEVEALTDLNLSKHGVQALAESLLTSGSKKVVITLGERGAFYHEGHSSGIVPAPSVKAIDTVGAGDAFNGGLATALAEGKSLEQAVNFAVRLSALKVTCKGSSVAMPTREEINDFHNREQ